MTFRTDPFILALTREFLDPISTPRTPFTYSRLAVLPDRTTRPVLLLLAGQKGKWDPSTHFPFWRDGDPTNETLENVAFAERTSRPHRRLNLPSGPDYNKRWRAANKDRMQHYRRTRAARLAALEELNADESK